MCITGLNLEVNPEKITIKEILKKNLSSIHFHLGTIILNWSFLRLTDFMSTTEQSLIVHSPFQLIKISFNDNLTQYWQNIIAVISPLSLLISFHFLSGNKIKPSQSAQNQIALQYLQHHCGAHLREQKGTITVRIFSSPMGRGCFQRSSREGKLD